MRHIWLSERTGVLGELIKTLMNLLIKKYFYFRLACSKHILWMQIARHLMIQKRFVVQTNVHSKLLTHSQQ